jgi:hypothetical protein
MALKTAHPALNRIHGLVNYFSQKEIHVYRALSTAKAIQYRQRTSTKFTIIILLTCTFITDNFKPHMLICTWIVVYRVAESTTGAGELGNNERQDLF